MNRLEKIAAVQQMSPEGMTAAQQAIEGLLARSASDYPFRQLLLTNPRAAIAEYAGKTVDEIPDSLNVVFIENEATATFVLPDAIPTDELADAELEAVAGGSASADIFAIIGLGIVIADEVKAIWKAGVEAGRAEMGVQPS